MSGGSPAPRPLPALELPITIQREERRLTLGRGEIFVGPLSPDDPRPRVVEWTVVGGLMPDEMILVFGRPLDWTGPKCDEDPSLTLIEHCLGGPLILTRHETTARSPEPALPPSVPGGVPLGWCFGAVLIRGEDNPWYAQSILRISRTGRDPRR